MNSKYLSVIQNQLAQFATQDNFELVFATAFGDQFDLLTAQSLRQQWLTGDFSVIPEIQVLTDGELAGAKGAYAAEIDKIFISSDFLATTSVKSVAAVLLEEVGHRIDKLLNGNVDSAGDEGKIFSLLVNGADLLPDALAALKVQDDHAVIVVGGEALAIEKAEINGGPLNDTIYGTSLPDIIHGYDGNDTLYGYDASDNGSFFSGDNDTLYGDNGNDFLYGGEGNDFLYGGDGNDFLYSENGADRLYGGDGNDNLFGGAGTNTIYLSAGNDLIYIYPGSATIFDNFYIQVGIETLITSPLSGDISINLTATNTQFIAPGVELAATNLDQIDNLTTFNGNDNLIGNSLDNIIDSRDGNDYLYGVSGKDTLLGGKGNDTYLVDRYTLYYSSGGTVIQDAGSTGIDTIQMRDFSFFAPPTYSILNINTSLVDCG